METGVGPGTLLQAAGEFLSEIYSTERKIPFASGEQFRETRFGAPNGVDHLEPALDMGQREVRRYENEFPLVVYVLYERAETFEGDFSVHSVEILSVFEKVVENDDLVILEKVVRGSEAEVAAKEHVLANPFFGILYPQFRSDCRDERFGEVRFSKAGAAGHAQNIRIR